MNITNFVSERNPMISELGSKFGLEEYTTSVQTAKYTNKDDDERFAQEENDL